MFCFVLIWFWFCLILFGFGFDLFGLVFGLVVAYALPYSSSLTRRFCSFVRLLLHVSSSLPFYLSFYLPLLPSLSLSLSLPLSLSLSSLQCSTCSPGAPDPYRPTCQNRYNNTAAPWCFSYIYDPEGVLSTIPTVMSAWLGTHFGEFVSLNDCFLVVSYHEKLFIYTCSNLTYMKLVFNGLLFFFYFFVNEKHTGRVLRHHDGWTVKNNFILFFLFFFS